MNGLESSADLDRLDFAKGNGLVTVVTQDARSGAVLMVAHADRDALERSVATREMHYRSRSRGLWRKGETSGNIQRVVALYHDCDGDAVLAQVEPAGPACHTGATGCFGEDAIRPLDPLDPLDLLDATIRRRADIASGDTAPSYTRRLLSDRNLRLKKLGEEAAELAVACADGDRERAVSESADVVYHMLVALRSLGAGLGDVRATLAERALSR
jgi:phosphoribosyl-ATP pyrophosphohydrolase/phosphoribosyl-AMP cyclohydrolase